MSPSGARAALTAGQSFVPSMPGTKRNRVVVSLLSPSCRVGVTSAAPTREPNRPASVRPVRITKIPSATLATIRPLMGTSKNLDSPTLGKLTPF